MKNFSMGFAVLACLLTGCSLVFQSERTRLMNYSKDADFGPPPPANYEEVESQWIRGKLKIGEGAKFKFGEFEKDAIPAACTSPIAILVRVHPVQVDVKDASGNYSGYKTYRVAWKDGQIAALFKPDNVTCWDYAQKEEKKPSH